MHCSSLCNYFQISYLEKLQANKFQHLALKKVQFTKSLCVQNLCKELHQKIDVVDEERYDIESKVTKNEREVSYISENLFELHGFQVKLNVLKI